MKLTYDPKYNVAYIRLRQRRAQVETVRVSDELNVDLAPDGTIYGIELLNARQQLNRDRKGILQLVNESSGKATQVKLPL